MVKTKGKKGMAPTQRCHVQRDNDKIIKHMLYNSKLSECYKSNKEIKPVKQNQLRMMF